MYEYFLPSVQINIYKKSDFPGILKSSRDTFKKITSGTDL